MNRTRDQHGSVKAKYAVRRRRQLALLVFMAATMLAITWLGDSQREPVFGMLAEDVQTALFVAIAASAIFSFRNWRCPGCSGYLGKNFNPKHCPECGVELHE
jgi:rubrerythrin